MLTEDSKGDVGGCIQKLSVKCETFEYIIDKYSMENLDLLQIDAEGYDFELIKIVSLFTSHTQDHSFRTHSPRPQRPRGMPKIPPQLGLFFCH